MQKYMVAGCRFGLTSIIKKSFGHPLCKAWAVWSNNPSLSMALDGPHVHCQGGHDYLAVSGQNTAHSGNYPDAFAKFIYFALTAPLADLRKTASSSEWPIVGPINGLTGGAQSPGGSSAPCQGGSGTVARPRAATQSTSSVRTRGLQTDCCHPRRSLGREDCGQCWTFPVGR